MAKKKKDVSRYRIQSSIEAEVARAKLARAHEAAEQGDADQALDLAVESAFDAGVATAFATKAGEEGFHEEVDTILTEAQQFVQSAGMQARAANAPVGRIKSGNAALKHARETPDVIGAVHYAGMAHGFGEVKGDTKLKADAIKVFDDVYRKNKPPMYSMAAVANPTPPLSTSKLKAKLLR